MYRGRLVISWEGKDVATPEYGGAMVGFEVGVPSGRIQASAPNGHKLWLRLLTNAATDAEVIAPTPKEITDGRRDVIVPGDTPDGQRVSWSVFLDDSTVETYEAFVAELREQGCPISRPPPH